VLSPNWLADTGATSHMTPHRAWMCNYTAHIVPIKLADHTIIYSVGMGSVVIHPVIKGQEACPVELTRVLHVPQLRNNLLACLHLTKRKGIRLEVNDSTMFFKRDRMSISSQDEVSARALPDSRVRDVASSLGRRCEPCSVQ
jgi:hypothetical protein